MTTRGRPTSTTAGAWAGGPSNELSLPAPSSPSGTASAGTAYTIGAPGTVYPAHGTVDAATITTGDSFEWAARASR